MGVKPARDEAKRRLRIGVDAGSISSGGGATHLRQLLAASGGALEHNGLELTVWATTRVASQLPAGEHINVVSLAALDRGPVMRAWWQAIRAPSLARRSCDVLFVPGGTFLGSFHPMVSMSQNLLPFERREVRRYGLSTTTLRLIALRFLQSQSMRKADGVIFLCEFAKARIGQALGHLRGACSVVPHGVEQRFFLAPRPQRRLSDYTTASPFRILYVSIVDVYKHQDNVARAVVQLWQAGFPVALTLVGPAYPPALEKLSRILEHLDGAGQVVHYNGAVTHELIHTWYHEADAFVFASSCENFPAVLLEAMAAGLPIAAAQRGPMPSILGGAALWFDPSDAGSIGEVLRTLIGHEELRARLAQESFSKATQYSWGRCAEQTLRFLAQVGERHSQSGRGSLGSRR